MKSRLLAMGVPAVVVAALFGGAGTWRTLGMSDPTWMVVWPILVAVAFLAMALGALFAKLRWLLWPFLTGFFVQGIGVLLFWLAGGPLFRNDPSGVLWWTFGAVALVVLVELVLWLVSFLRARQLENKMRAGVGIEGADPQKVEEIRKDMSSALALLKRAGAGRNAIYDLPWFLVIGRSQVGKTIAIKNSGLGLPVRKDWVKGVGGTHTCDWFFTNDLIFLDTPGAWVTEGATEEGQHYWRTLLRLLRKFRGRRPLDGLVVVVSADDLLTRADSELQEQAGNVREVLDLLQEELHFRFPVYLLVSKCDLVEGFVDFFRSVPAQRWHEILGWSNPEPNETDAVRLIPAAFQPILRRLRGYRLEIVARMASASRARRVFFFPEEFKRLERPLATFADVLFYDDPSHESPVFRGFYFSSGTQGEGSILGHSMAQLARSLGVRLGAAGTEEKEEPKRSYFLLELFRSLMVGDDGLVSRTAGHWWRQRRDTFFAAFLPASAALVVLLLSLISFSCNSCAYRNAALHIPEVVKNIDGRMSDPLGTKLIENIEDLEAISDHDWGMVAPSLFRRFGMRQPGGLEYQTLRILRGQFEKAVLTPTLERAKELAADRSSTCAQRLDVLYAVVWLREGQRGESNEDLRGLKRLWDLEESDQERVAAKFIDLFSYVGERSPKGTSLLPGFSLAEVSRGIRDDCSAGGIGNPLDRYRTFQRECAEPGSRSKLERCYEHLVAAAGGGTEDPLELRGRLLALKAGLNRIREREPEAEAAYDALKSISTDEGTRDRCVDGFVRSVVPSLKSQGFIEQQKEAIEQCQQAISRAPNKRVAAYQIVADQFKEEEKAVAPAFKEFNASCSAEASAADPLDPNALFEFLRTYRRVECLGEEAAPPPARLPPIPGETRTPSRRPDQADKPSRPSGMIYVEAPIRPEERYTLRGWAPRQRQWEEVLETADSPGPVETERRGLRDSVATEVERYAQGYAEAWRRYLDGLKLRRHEGDVPNWLKALSTTDEFSKVLQPAAQALALDPPQGRPEFEALRGAVGALKGVSEFAGAKLSEYQSRLARVAEDVARCERDHAHWIQYRNRIDSSGSLFDAREWVNLQAGTGLAGGALREFLLSPLDEARRYVLSDNLALAKWADLRAVFERAKARFPIAGAAESDELIELPDLTSLLGGASGLVPALAGGAPGATLSPQASQWLERAARYSTLFFKGSTDDPRQLSLQLELKDVVFDPPKLADDYRLEKLAISFGGGKEFVFEAGQEESGSGKLVVSLFGDEVGTLSKVILTLGEKKLLGRGYQRQNPVTVKSHQGPWAALAILDAGIPDGERNTSDTQGVQYTMTMNEKKKQYVKVSLTVSAEGLGRLLALRREGMKPPPVSPMAGD